MPEAGKRACHVCGDSYLYPAPRSTATRLYCEACAAIDPNVRRVLEGMARRLSRIQPQAAGTPREEPDTLTEGVSSGS